MNVITSPFGVKDILKLKEAGANTMVVGSSFFSVRSAGKFNLEEIQEAKTICKENKLELYVLVNRFFMEDELEDLRKYLKQLKEIDVDGIYFSDLGVFYEAKVLGIENKLIYNPDTILTNAKDVEAYLSLGIKMCTLSKEITLEDMISIANKVKDSLEVIVHGRLHMLDSKRMLISNYMEFIGSDRQVRNNQYLSIKEEKREEKMPILEDSEGTHIFTGFTLCSFEELDDILKAGIDNIRIESMYTTMEELCQIIKDYRMVEKQPDRGREYYQRYQQDKVEQNIGKGFLYKKTGAQK